MYNVDTMQCTWHSFKQNNAKFENVCSLNRWISDACRKERINEKIIHVLALDIGHNIDLFRGQFCTNNLNAIQKQWI